MLTSMIIRIYSYQTCFQTSRKLRLALRICLQTSTKKLLTCATIPALNMASTCSLTACYMVPTYLIPACFRYTPKIIEITPNFLLTCIQYTIDVHHLFEKIAFPCFLPSSIYLLPTLYQSAYNLLLTCMMSI